jgi:hypothetical protein
MTATETPQVKKLYDGLSAIPRDKGEVYIVNTSGGMLYPTVCEAVAPGDAGGLRTVRSESIGVYPGIDRVPAGWWGRLKVDAGRQRERKGGVLAQLLDSGTLKSIDLDRASDVKVAALLRKSANIGLIAELRGHKKHGAAAQAAFDAWHSLEASNETKMLRHFWAMRTGSRKVA